MTASLYHRGLSSSRMPFLFLPLIQSFPPPQCCVFLYERILSVFNTTQGDPLYAPGRALNAVTAELFCRPRDACPGKLALPNTKARLMPFSAENFFSTTGRAPPYV